jgi:hypothetical protein
MPTKKGKTQRFYDSNPASAAKKAKYQKSYNARPAAKAKRAELNKINRDRGTYGNHDGKDASHTRSGIKMKPQSVNRGSKSDSPGDVRARGRKPKR